MNELIRELEKIYPSTQFKRAYRDEREVLIYNNEELEFDEQFIDKVIELAEQYLSKDQINGFSYIYDYLDEMSLCDCSEIFDMNYTSKFGSLNFRVASVSCSVKIEYDSIKENLYKKINYFKNKSEVFCLPVADI